MSGTTDYEQRLDTHPIYSVPGGEEAVKQAKEITHDRTQAVVIAWRLWCLWRRGREFPKPSPSEESGGSGDMLDPQEPTP